MFKYHRKTFLLLAIWFSTCESFQNCHNCKAQSILSSSECNGSPTQLLAASSWSDLEQTLEIQSVKKPVSLDSALDTSTPNFSTERPTFFRERHGWCPYSERVWLALELAGSNTHKVVKYDTVRIDNTGHGPRPSYYGGQTPQMRWPEGRTQGESMDLVEEIDERYANGSLLSSDPDIQDCIRQFSNIFPRARPSSRAAYLFQYNGEPIWKSTFEETLQKANDKLFDKKGGPFMAGQSAPTAADIAYAPFLERYRYQLPCLHPGLNPADASKYPQLSQWYDAMDQIPVYACRIKGDASSWRKVLTMAGFGNAGVPPSIQQNMQERVLWEETQAKDCIDQQLWEKYRQQLGSSDYYTISKSPYWEVATIITQNKAAIVKDAQKRMKVDEEVLDAALSGLVTRLVEYKEGQASFPIYLEGEDMSVTEQVAKIAAYLDERMCVPRDMGAMSASVLKTVAVSMREVLP